MKTKKIIQLALFTTIALTIFILESFIPPLIPVPGVKLGLANIITLYLLGKYGKKEALLVLLLRIVLASLFAGQIISLLYSLSGGLFCYFSMIFMNTLLKNSYIYLTSIVGAIFHNIGQLLAAAFLMQQTAIFVYAPVLMVSSIITGLFTGLCTYYLIKKLPKTI